MLVAITMSQCPDFCFVRFWVSMPLGKYAPRRIAEHNSNFDNFVSMCFTLTKTLSTLWADGISAPGTWFQDIFGFQPSNPLGIKSSAFPRVFTMSSYSQCVNEKGVRGRGCWTFTRTR